MDGIWMVARLLGAFYPCLLFTEKTPRSVRFSKGKQTHLRLAYEKSNIKWKARS